MLRLSLKSGGESFTLKSGDSHLNRESWNLCDKQLLLFLQNLHKIIDCVYGKNYFKIYKHSHNLEKWASIQILSDCLCWLVVDNQHSDTFIKFNKLILCFITITRGGLCITIPVIPMICIFIRMMWSINQKLPLWCTNHSLPCYGTIAFDWVWLCCQNSFAIWLPNWLLKVQFWLTRLIDSV